MDRKRLEELKKMAKDYFEKLTPVELNAKCEAIFNRYNQENCPLNKSDWFKNCGTHPECGLCRDSPDRNNL